MAEWLQLREVTPLDGAVLAIVLIAGLRGMWIGLIREGCSLIALGGSFVAVRALITPASDWLVRVTDGGIGETAAPFIAGVAIGFGTWLLVGFGARMLQRGAEVAGLGWADRVFGGALGAAEGALVAGLLILVGSTLVGRDSALMAESRSLAAFDTAQAYLQEQEIELPSVAAPGKDD